MTELRNALSLFDSNDDFTIFLVLNSCILVTDGST